MPSRVIALIYTHDGDGVYHTSANSETKALLRKINKAITERYGHRVGTCWGDDRGRNQAGAAVLGYAQCMTVPEAQVDWLLTTFWGSSGAAFQEQIPGVGYINKSGGRAPMFEFDVSKGDDAVQAFLSEHFEIGWTPPTVAEKPVVSADCRKVGTIAPDDPFMTMELDDLRALCTIAGVDFQPTDSHEMVRSLYMQAMSQ